MIITSINGKSVANGADINSALTATKDNMIRIMGISSDGSRVSYNFQVE